MATRLRNDEAEVLLLEIRAARQAATHDIGDRVGAFLTFPTSVVVPGPAGGQCVYPLRIDVEPGALVSSAGSAQVSGQVAGVAVRGRFHWSFDDEPAAAGYCFGRGRVPRRAADPSWADQLPASQLLLARPPEALARQQLRMNRRGRLAEHRLLRLSEATFQGACQGPMRRAIRFRPLLDVDDVVQRGLQVAGRLLPIYASPARPPCSWVGMLTLDGRRDMHREVARLDGFPTDVVTALSLADAADIDLRGDGDATVAALRVASERLGRVTPRVSAAPLVAALRAPVMLANDTGAAHMVDGPETSTLEQLSYAQGSRMVATVARLVTDDPTVIASAVDGDRQALRRVGDGVVRRLSETREGTRTARHRCWDEFQASGQLFASPAGLARFSPGADPNSLAAIDERLRRAAGLRLAAGPG